MSRKNLIVGQSGGPTAVINSSLYGVVSEGMRHPEAIEHVYGMINGIEGFLNGTVLDFAEALPGEKLDGLKVTPGAYLGSCRYKLPESLEDPVYPRLFKKFEEMNIGWFFYIGGNDSMDTVSKLSRYAAQTGSDIRILGEPKTIDNDLIHTDHTFRWRYSFVLCPWISDPHRPYSGIWKCSQICSFYSPRDYHRCKCL